VLKRTGSQADPAVVDASPQVQDRRRGERRAGDRRAVDPEPRERRSSAASALARGARTAVKWTLAVTVLLVVGAGAVWKGWTLLVESGADRRSAPAACVDRAVAEAEEFAAVLGDGRPVERAALERSCPAPS
jgi:hypothetical protein